MGLADLVPYRWDPANRSAIEYGSDGSPTGGVFFTPWTGLINDGPWDYYVTEEVASGLPGIGRGVELISGVVAQLEPLLYQYSPKAHEQPILLDTPPLLRDPDPMWHPGNSAWLAAFTSSLQWYGDAFAYRGPEVSDTRGYPLRLPLLSALGTTWQSASSGLPSGYWVNGSLVEPGSLLHALVGPRAGFKMGQGILDRYQTELRILIATEAAQFVVMKEGRPYGIITTDVDLNKPEAAEAKTAFTEAMKSSGVAVMSRSDFKPVQWNASDLSLVDAREFNLRLASDIVGVPPYLLGVPSESRVYSNMETEWSNFVRVTLGRYLSAIEDALSSCYPTGKVVRMDVDVLMRGDAAARWSVYEKAINLQVASPEEVRRLEGLPPAVGGVPEPDQPPEVEPPSEPTPEGGDQDE